MGAVFGRPQNVNNIQPPVQQQVQQQVQQPVQQAQIIHVPINMQRDRRTLAEIRRANINADVIGIADQRLGEEAERAREAEKKAGSAAVRSYVSLTATFGLAVFLVASHIFRSIFERGGA